MRLVEIEQQLKDLIKEDINDPQVFYTLHDLCYFYIKRGKKVNNDMEAREIALNMSEDLYMKILSGGEIYSWIGYINKVLIWFIRKYRNENNSEIIDATDNIMLKEGIERMSTSGSNTYSYSQYDEVTDRLCIDNIPDMVNRILCRICRYHEDSSEYSNIYLSIMTSLIQGKYVHLFISDEVEPYCRMMYSLLKDKLSKELIEVFKTESNLSGDYSLMQLIILEDQD